MVQTPDRFFVPKTSSSDLKRFQLFASRKILVQVTPISSVTSNNTTSTLQGSKQLKKPSSKDVNLNCSLIIWLNFFAFKACPALFTWAKVFRDFSGGRKYLLNTMWRGGLCFAALLSSVSCCAEMAERKKHFCIVALGGGDTRGNWGYGRENKTTVVCCTGQEAPTKIMGQNPEVFLHVCIAHLTQFPAISVTCWVWCADTACVSFSKSLRINF